MTCLYFLSQNRSSTLWSSSLYQLLLWFVFGILLLLLLSHFSRVQLVRPHRRQPTRLPRPWDSPGKNTGVGYQFRLQCMKVKVKVKLLSRVLTLSDPMECSLPGSSVQGIFQARVLEWVWHSAWPQIREIFSCFSSTFLYLKLWVSFEFVLYNMWDKDQSSFLLLLL